jgi:dTDP-glucose 4,6-dehydratase
MNILVTGGYGFIGSNLIKEIIRTTSHSVLNIDCLTYASNLESLEEVENSSRYTFKKLDICDEHGLTELFDSNNIDCIMHLAAESHVDNSIENPSAFINTNILGTYNLLQIATKYFNTIDKVNKDRFRFIHISTDEVFGSLGINDDKFNEDTAYDPSSPYSASKASSDHLVRAWGRTYNFPFIISNCSNNYGPFQNDEKLIPQTIHNAINAKNIPIYGDGKQIRDWLFVQDHAKALLKILKDGVVGESYNVGGSNEKTNLEVVNTICHILDALIPNKPIEIKSFADLITHVQDRPGHDYRYAINSSKLNNLGWYADESFESGILKTVNWYIDKNSRIL